MARTLSFAHRLETISTLFKNCTQAFDSIGIIEHGCNAQPLLFRLSIERCRLCIWFQAITLYPEEGYALSCASLKVAERDLGLLLQYLAWPCMPTQSGSTKYLYASQDRSDYNRDIAVLVSYFDDFGAKSRFSTASPITRYAFDDQHRFLEFLAVVKTRIDALQESTIEVATVAAQDQETIRRIININEQDTLQMISQACQQDYPHFAEAARNTTKAAASLSISTAHWKVGRWMQDTEFVSAQPIQPDAMASECSEYRMDGVSSGDGTSVTPFWFNEGESASNLFWTPQEYTMTSSDSDTNRKSATPILMPIDVMRTDVNCEGNTHEHNIGDIMVQATDRCSSDFQPHGFVEEDLDGKPTQYAVSDTQCAASDASSTIIADDQSYLSKSSLNTGSRRRDSVNRQSPDASESSPRINPEILKKDPDSKISNGFMDIDIMCNRTHDSCNDYFVLSFCSGRNDMNTRVNHCAIHTHYVGAHYAARCVHTKEYVTFDLESWPRNLQVGAFVDAEEVDRCMMKAMRKTKLQVNAFLIPTLDLPFCSSSHGGCLRVLYDALADGRSFGRCLPTITMGGDRAPDVFMVPIGSKTFMPTFFLHQAPRFQPKADILLILMVLWN